MHLPHHGWTESDTEIFFSHHMTACFVYLKHRACQIKWKQWWQTASLFNWFLTNNVRSVWYRCGHIIFLTCLALFLTQSRVRKCVLCVDGVLVGSGGLSAQWSASLCHLNLTFPKRERRDICLFFSVGSFKGCEAWIIDLSLSSHNTWTGASLTEEKCVLKPASDSALHHRF